MRFSLLYFRCLIQFAVYLSAYLGSQTAFAQGCLKIGTNLSNPDDWVSEWPLVDIMKYSRTWLTTNSNGGPWDTMVADSIAKDANGYPLQIPAVVAGQSASQVMFTVWANTAVLPLGTYTVLWEGSGTLSFWGDATNATLTGPNRMTFNLIHKDNVFTLTIRTSQLGNHVRNIRVLMPNTEATYQTNPWNQTWLDKLAPFSTLRFMDWAKTNYSPQQNWEKRTTPSRYTYTEQGMPFELMVAISNKKKSDAWVCVPHLADDNYVTQMATLFRDNMDPNLKIYVEYSNELWNWGFSQAQYGLGINTHLTWPESLSPRISHVMQIWTDVFAGQTHRLVRVLGGQHGWFDVMRRIYLQMETDGKAGLIDAFSPAAYMGLNSTSLKNLTSATTGLDIINMARSFAFDPAGYHMTGWKQHAQFAQTKNKKLIFYEGGQHFTPDPFGTVQPYAQALMDAQTHPDIYGLYNQLFDTLKTLTDQEMLFMNFSFIGQKNERYGSWGVLENQFSQSPPYNVSAPKYQVLLDAIQNNSCNNILPICPTVKVYLEGNWNGSEMTTKLNQQGLLPGQTPLTTIIPSNATPSGHPYKIAPWYFAGTETVSSYDADVVDWVMLSLRTSPGDTTTNVFKTAALLRKNGMISLLVGCPTLNPTLSYYVTVEHRNHIGATSHQAVSINNNQITYDFTQQESYIPPNVPSSGQVKVGAVYCLMGGDAAKTLFSEINANDNSVWRIDNGIFARYRAADYNLDGDINAIDDIIWRRNNGKFSSVQR